MDIPWWEFCVRILILYVIVMTALRLMGKREIGQLSVFDFVVSMMIAELSTLPMEDTAIPLYVSVVSIGLLVLLQVAVAVLQAKSHKFRHWVEGEPVVLVQHGQIHDKEMRRLRYSLSDLLLQLREKGVGAVADVEFAILENSGKLSVLPKAEKRALTASDLAQPVKPEFIPLPLVMDGKIVPKSLRQIQRDKEWLLEQLHQRGYGALEQVFFATVNTDGKLYIDPFDDSKQPDDPSG